MGSDASSEYDTSSRSEIKPAVTIPVALIAITVAVGLVALGIWLGEPLGGVDAVQVFFALVFVLCVISFINLAFKIVLLRSTKYIVDDDILVKKFNLMYLKSEREIPIHQMRGVELNKNPLESLFGYGTLVFLTAGPNRSLGFVEFEHITNPEEHRDAIRALVQE